MRIAYISWAPHCSRSDYTAKELGGTSHMVYWGWLGSHPATVWLKYLGQTLSTWSILLSERPDAVFAMSPPVVAGLAVYPVARLLGIPYVIDAHTGAFLDPRWRHFQGLQHWLCKRAATTIVTNTHQASLLTEHGSHFTMVPTVPVRYPGAEGIPKADAFTVANVCSFDRDEPIAEFLEAARQLPDVRFRVTGDASRAGEVTRNLPPNVELTGFLSNEDYGRLLSSSHVVMILTTGKLKMLRGAYEAIYQGTPIVISESPLLRQEFSRGAIYVDNSPASLVAAIREMQRDLDHYAKEAVALRAIKEEQWAASKRDLLARLGA